MGRDGTAPVVLVVDDEEPIRHLVRVVLRGIAEVEEVATGADALERAPDLAPSLVLLDARLPDMDGLAVARILKERVSAPIVMISGELGVTWSDPAIDGSLRKPFDIDALRACVRGFLET